MGLLKKLGFMVNREKSVLIPSTRICYLGHIIDSVEGNVYLPREKICLQCELLLLGKKHTIKEVVKLIGLFTSSMYPMNLAGLFLRHLDKDKVNALMAVDNDYYSVLHLSKPARNVIIWWKNNARKKNGKWIRNPQIGFYLETDASKSG